MRTSVKKELVDQKVNKQKKVIFVNFVKNVAFVLRFDVPIRTYELSLFDWISLNQQGHRELKEEVK